jgi:hypothetical protein
MQITDKTIFQARYKTDSTVEYQTLTEHSDETGRIGRKMMFKVWYKADFAMEYQGLTEHPDKTGMYYPEGRSGRL